MYRALRGYGCGSRGFLRARTGDGRNRRQESHLRNNRVNRTIVDWDGLADRGEVCDGEAGHDGLDVEPAVPGEGCVINR